MTLGTFIPVLCLLMTVIQLFVILKLKNNGALSPGVMGFMIASAFLLPIFAYVILNHALLELGAIIVEL